MVALDTTTFAAHEIAGTSASKVISATFGIGVGVTVDVGVGKGVHVGEGVTSGKGGCGRMEIFSLLVADPFEPVTVTEKPSPATGLQVIETITGEPVTV